MKIPTLSLLKLLEDNGFGTIDKDLFFEKMPLGATGLYIASVGMSQAKGERRRQGYDIYVRGKNDIEARKLTESVADFICNCNICELPAVPPIADESVKGVELDLASTPTSLGLDDHGRVLFRISGTIYY